MTPRTMNLQGTAPPLELFTVLVTSRDARGVHDVLSTSSHADVEDAEAATREAVRRFIGDHRAHFICLLESVWADADGALPRTGWRIRRRAAHDLHALRDLEALVTWLCSFERREVA